MKQILIQTDKNRQTELIRHAYDLGLLANNMLSGKELSAFLERSLAMLK
jgi:hypothetical protein